MKAQLDTELRELGQELLVLPTVNNDAYQDAYLAAATAYLDIYDQTRIDETPDTMLDALQALQAIKQQIIELEHQAQPYQWASVPQQPQTGLHYALSTTTSPQPVIARLGLESMLLADTDGDLLDDGASISWSTSVVFTARRRGPPAAMEVESVFAGERLPESAAQSLFFLFRGPITA